jgi:hypothetical protein
MNPHQVRIQTPNQTLIRTQNQIQNLTQILSPLDHYNLVIQVGLNVLI